MKWKMVLTAIVLTSSVMTPAQTSFPLFYNYVVANYTCRRESGVRNIKLYSQVWGACFADGLGYSHPDIANRSDLNNLNIAEQKARLDCEGGTVRFEGFRVGAAHSGPGAQEKAEKERADAMKSSIKHGLRVESFEVNLSFYSKTVCR